MAWIAIGVVLAVILAIMLTNWIGSRNKSAQVAARASARAEVAASFSGPESLVNAYLDQLEKGDVVAAWAIANGTSGERAEEEGPSAEPTPGEPTPDESTPGEPTPGASERASRSPDSSSGDSQPASVVIPASPRPSPSATPLPTTGPGGPLALTFESAQPLVCNSCYQKLEARVSDASIESVTYGSGSKTARVKVTYKVGNEETGDVYQMRQAGSTELGYPTWEFAKSPFAEVTIKLPDEGHVVVAGANCDGALNTTGAEPTVTMAAAPGVYPVDFFAGGTEQHWTVTVPSSTDPATSGETTGPTPSTP